MDEEGMRSSHWFGVSALCSIQCSDSCGWVAERTCGPYRPVPLIPEVFFQNRWREGKLEGEPADPGRSGKMYHIITYLTRNVGQCPT